MSCPDCFKGSIHDHAEPKGKLEDLYGYKNYVTLPSDNANPKSTIIFFTDAFGLNLVNNKILADHYAHATGCRVLVPDIIPGGAASVASMHAINHATKPLGPTWAEWLNPFTYIGKGLYFVQVLATMVPFMIRANPTKAYPKCLAYAREVRAGMAADGKLGVAGFCWGGYQSTHLCTAADVEGGSKALVDAQFNAHPSALKAPDDVVEAIEKFKVPYSCAVAEFDMMFDKKVSDDTEAAVRQKLGEGVGTYEFVIHKNCHHGFSVRASFDEGAVGKDGYEGAAKQAVDWFNKYLH